MCLFVTVLLSREKARKEGKKGENEPNLAKEKVKRESEYDDVVRN